MDYLVAWVVGLTLTPGVWFGHVLAGGSAAHLEPKEQHPEAAKGDQRPQDCPRVSARPHEDPAGDEQERKSHQWHDVTPPGITFPQEYADEPNEDAAHENARPGIFETRDGADGRADQESCHKRNDHHRGDPRPAGESPQRRARGVGHTVAEVSTGRSPDEGRDDKDTVGAGERQ